MKPRTLQEAIRYFSDEDVCIKTVTALRWPDGKPRCPKCAKTDHYWLKTQRRWKCKGCSRQFSVKQRTIFEDSPIPLDKWLTALWMLTNCKNGVSSYEVARAIGVTQKSAWFMLHRLRLAMQSRPLAMSKAGGSGREVEVDETFIAPDPKNMHKERRLRYNQQRTAGERAQSIVVGVLDREQRQVRTKVVSDVKRETLQAAILRNIKYGSRVYTDSAAGYDRMYWQYVHEVVNKVEGYVKGRVHTNGLENFWSLLKRGLRGTYVAVEPSTCRVTWMSRCSGTTTARLHPARNSAMQTASMRPSRKSQADA